MVDGEAGSRTIEKKKVLIHNTDKGKVIVKKHGAHEDELLFIPHHALKEGIAAVLFFIILIFLVALIPAPLDHRANLFQSPLGVKPEWYFLAPFELLHLLPPLLAMSIQGIFVVLLLLLPFLDRRPQKVIRRPILFPVSLLIIASMVVLSAMAYFKKG